MTWNAQLVLGLIILAVTTVLNIGVGLWVASWKFSRAREHTMEQARGLMPLYLCALKTGLIISGPCKTAKEYHEKLVDLICISSKDEQLKEDFRELDGFYQYLNDGDYSLNPDRKQTDIARIEDLLNRYC